MANEFSSNLINLIKHRRSVRSFTGKKIPKKEIISIIEAGTWAPSGCNNQELKFLILDKEKEIKRLIQFKPFLTNVSNFVLVFYDMSLPRSKKMYNNRHQKMLPFIDSGLAVSNMLLYAKSKGIDSCVLNFSEYYFKPTSKLYTRSFNKFLSVTGLGNFFKSSFEHFLRKELQIPKHLEIVCCVALGFAERYPNVNTAVHSGDRIMRKNIDYYIIKK